jgi:hypothetical protein
MYILCRPVLLLKQSGACEDMHFKFTSFPRYWIKTTEGYRESRALSKCPESGDYVCCRPRLSSHLD